MDAKSLLPYKNIAIILVIIIIFAVAAQKILSNYSLKKQMVESQIRELEAGKIAMDEWGKLEMTSRGLRDSFLVDDTLFFKKFVEEKANDSGVKITSLQATNDEKDFYWEAIMHVGISCSYENLIKFLKAVEKKNISLMKGEITADSGAKDIKVALTLKGIVLKK